MLRELRQGEAPAYACPDCPQRVEHARVTGVIPMVVALAVLILWDGYPLGVLLRRTLDGDCRVGLESRVVKLGHRLADLLAENRPILTEILDVPLI